MTVLIDTTEQIEKVDVQILNLLEERMRLCREGRLDRDQETELFSLFLQGGEERGLDEERIERIGKAFVALCRNTHE